MTVSTPSTAPAPAAAAAPSSAPADGDTAALCATCGHPTAAHDAVGIRYCAATLNSALSRACICDRTAASFRG